MIGHGALASGGYTKSLRQCPYEVSLGIIIAQAWKKKTIGYILVSFLAGNRNEE